MAHECTNCGRVYENGSDAILSGCNDCGSRKFQYVSRSERPDSGGGPSSGTGEPSVSEWVEDAEDHNEPQDAASRATSSGELDYTGTDWPESGQRKEYDHEPERSREELTSDEGTAPRNQGGAEGDESVQKKALSETVPRDEWPDDSPQLSTADIRRETDPAVVQEKLNEEFGGIRVMSPGQYELDLMNLYESEDWLIQVEENGQYTIHRAGTWEQEEV